MNNKYLAITGIIIAIFILKLLTSKSNKSSKKKDYTFIKNELLTKAEKSFFGVLKLTIENNYHINCKVRLADVIKSKPYSQGAFNSIKSKHIDFVISDPQTMTIIACIELNDKSHNNENRQKRDTFLKKALQSAEIPLITFKCKNSYKTSEIEEEIQKIFSKNNTLDIA